MSSASPLQPVDPATFHLNEQENEKPWIVRKIVQSMPGRIAFAVGETLRATGTTVICLSPWGDSVPLILPCLRFRDVIIHTVVAATGGAALIATPLMSTAGGVVVDSFGSSIIVEISTLAMQEGGVKVANYLLIDKPANLLIPIHSNILETTDLKKILITLQFKHILTDASLGYYRAPTASGEPTLFSNVKEYLSIEKGWFNPYLFASCRRPLIPRTMIPDVVFCHGPWLKGDYSIGSTLLRESNTVIALTPDPDLPPEEEDPSLFKKALAALNFGAATPSQAGLSPEAAEKYEDRPPSPHGFGERVSQMFGHSRAKSKEASTSSSPAGGADPAKPGGTTEYGPPSHPPPGYVQPPGPTPATAPVVAPAAATNGVTTMIDRLTDQINEWRGVPNQPTTETPSDSTLAVPPPPPPNRRMVMLVVAISPHRVGVWTSSARPGESVMNYTLLNGCPTLVVPIKPGCPLIAWHAVTLKTLQGLKGGIDGQAFKEMTDVLVNYMELCVDNERIELPPNYAEKMGLHGTDTENRQRALRGGVELVLAGAVRSGASSKVKKDIDAERAGIVFFRIP